MNCARGYDSYAQFWLAFVLGIAGERDRLHEWDRPRVVELVVDPESHLALVVVYCCDLVGVRLDLTMRAVVVEASTRVSSRTGPPSG